MLLATRLRSGRNYLKRSDRGQTLYTLAYGIGYKRFCIGLLRLVAEETWHCAAAIPVGSQKR